MQRRNFLRNGLTAAASSLVLGDAFASSAKNQGNDPIAVGSAEKTFKMNYAPHDGMFANHAGKDFVDQIKFMHDQGFRAIEDNGMLGRSKEDQ